MTRTIIAVDFDGTLCVDSNANAPLIQALRMHQARGDPVILNTCRTGKRLQEAVSFCARHGLHFQAVNENLPQVVRMLGHNPRKIYADVYIDDKAVRP